MSQDLKTASTTPTVWYAQKKREIIVRGIFKSPPMYSQAFELLHRWTGLLVEANPAIFPVGFLSGRKAWQVICFPF